MTEWISVEERRPDSESFLGTDGEVVFAAYWSHDSYVVGGWKTCYCCGGQSDVSLDKEDIDTRKVTHWMPIPALPKDES